MAKQFCEMLPLQVPYSTMVASRDVVARTVIAGTLDLAFIPALACWTDSQPFQREYLPLTGCSKVLAMSQLPANTDVEPVTVSTLATMRD